MKKFIPHFVRVKGCPAFEKVRNACKKINLENQDTFYQSLLLLLIQQKLSLYFLHPWREKLVTANLKKNSTLKGGCKWSLKNPKQRITPPSNLLLMI